MREALKPGGGCYIGVRNFEQLLAVRSRYDVREERPVPHGRVIRLEHWLYDREEQVVNVWIFTTALRDAGFEAIHALPEGNAWDPIQLIARRPALERRTGPAFHAGSNAPPASLPPGLAHGARLAARPPEQVASDDQRIKRLALLELAGSRIKGHQAAVYIPEQADPHLWGSYCGPNCSAPCPSGYNG
jgi:hypothetical protein